LIFKKRWRTTAACWSN